MAISRSEPRPEKVEAVAEIQTALAGAQSAVLVEMQGLSVAQATELRRQLREKGVVFKVYKNTLIRLAASNIGIEGLEPFLHGHTALALSKDDPGAASRVLRAYKKGNDQAQVSVKGGTLGLRTISAADAEALADLPTYEQAVAMLAGALNAPIAGLASSLNAIVSGLARALDQVRAQKEETAV